MTVLKQHNPRARKLAAFAHSEEDAKLAVNEFKKQAELDGDYVDVERSGNQVAANLFAWNIVDNKVEYK